MKLNLKCRYRTSQLTSKQKTKLIIYEKLHDYGFLSFEFLFSKYVKYGVIDINEFWGNK